MKEQSWLECIRGCGTRYAIDEVVYTCEKCGGLLDVVHDMRILKQHSGQDWKQLFDVRAGKRSDIYASGVWAKKEWVCPQISNDEIVSFQEGNSPLIPVPRLGQQIGLLDLWMKLCGNSHTGSFKDLGMTVLVSLVKHMIAHGSPIKAIACASTGDTSAALSAYAAAAGIPAVILLPRDKVSPEQLIQPLSNGAKVLSLDTDFDGCMRIVQELTKDPTIYLANSMNSLRMEGQKTVGIEIVQQFDWHVPDWIILPAGNLGNVSALGKGLLMMQELGLIDRLPRIACGQAQNANPFYLAFKNDFTHYQPVAAQKTMASAIQIGAPVSYERAVKIMHIFNGVVEQVSEQEIADINARADHWGLYCCPQTAVALGAAQKLVERGVIHSDERVVVISTANGLKFSQFKLSYHTEKLPNINATFKNKPVELNAKISEVMKAIE
ncbi:MAG TPA: threonine synthase [Anaerolineaceae bacterium]|nr:threonine synthase [Anaerolineaceae bacterium]